MRGSSLRTPFTTLKVEASPAFSTSDQNPALPILPHDVGLRRESVADGGDIVQIDGGRSYLLDREIVERRHGGRAGVQADVIFVPADLRGARRQD